MRMGAPVRCRTAALLQKGRCAAGCAVAMLGFAAGLLVVAPPAWAADEPTRIQPAAEGVGATAVRVQPIAKQFAPPNQPDLTDSRAREIEELFRQLMCTPTATSPGPPPSGCAKR
jgi:hypothetical protein